MFTLRLALTMLIAALAAALISPFVAALLARAGFHFPFPRILDRVVIVALVVGLLWKNRDLELIPRLRRGFAQPRHSLTAAALGAATGAGAIALLWGLAILAARSGANGHPAPFVLTLILSIIPALFIAVFEEAFFRAFLMDGMAHDFGRRIGLIASSAIYAAAHLVRSPARFQVAGVHPLMGLYTLAASLAQLCHPKTAAPGLLGLFLLGLLLGTAFFKTGRIYFSIGLHASVIIGAKTWRKFAPGAQSAPGWLSGYGPPPLISGAAAWLITLALLVAVSRLMPATDSRSFSQS